MSGTQSTNKQVRMKLRSAGSGWGDRIGCLLCQSALAKSLNVEIELEWQTPVGSDEFVRVCDDWETIRRHCHFPDPVQCVQSGPHLPSFNKFFNNNIQAPPGYLVSNDGYDINPQTALRTYIPRVSSMVSAETFLENYRFVARQFLVTPPLPSKSGDEPYIALHLRGTTKSGSFAPGFLQSGFELIDKVASGCPGMRWLLLTEDPTLRLIFKEFLDSRRVQYVEDEDAGVRSIEGLLQDFCYLMGSAGIVQYSPGGWSSFSHVAALTREIPIITVSPERLAAYSGAGGKPDHFFVAGDEQAFIGRIAGSAQCSRAASIKRIYIINLERRTDRKNLVTGQMERFGIQNSQFFPAIDATDYPTIDDMLESNGYPALARNVYPRWVRQKNYRCRAKTGCALSHLEVLRTIADLPAGWYAVLEDDIEFQYAQWVLDLALQKVADAHPTCPMVMLTDRHGIAHATTGLHQRYGLDAYAITPEGARIIVGSIDFGTGTFHPDYSPDNHIAHLCQTGSIEIRVLDAPWVYNVDPKLASSDIERGEYQKTIKPVVSAGLFNLGISGPHQRLTNSIRLMLYVPRRCNGVHEEVCNDVVYVRKGRQSYKLNGPASLVWGLCDGTHSAHEMCQSIVDTFDHEFDAVRSQLLNVLEEFTSNGLILK